MAQKIKLVLRESYEEFVKDKDRAFMLFATHDPTKHLFNQDDRKNFIKAVELRN